MSDDKDPTQPEVQHGRQPEGNPEVQHGRQPVPGTDANGDPVDHDTIPADTAEDTADADEADADADPHTD